LLNRNKHIGNDLFICHKFPLPSTFLLPPCFTVFQRPWKKVTALKCKYLNLCINISTANYHEVAFNVSRLQNDCLAFVSIPLTKWTSFANYSTAGFVSMFEIVFNNTLTLK